MKQKCTESGVEEAGGRDSSTALLTQLESCELLVNGVLIQRR